MILFSPIWRFKEGVIRMKIAMMTNNYKPFVAGVPISIERLTDSLRNQGHQVVVFAPSYDGQEPEDGVVRYSSLLKGIAGGASVPNSLDPEIERQFREGGFDVIHVHHPMLIGHTARYLSQKYRVPLVFTYHTRYEQYLHYVGLSGLKGLMPTYVRNCTRYCELIIAPTPLIKDYLEEIQQEVPVQVLPTGVPEDSFNPDEIQAAKIRQTLLEDKKYLFCTVARLAKEKNLEFLLDSLKRRKDAGYSDFKLALIGDGPERQKLEKYAADLDLQNEIVFIGKVPNKEIKNYCKAADLFLFSSCSETQGIVLLEAMAAGTPVLALRATGTEDVVVNGQNGYMTEVSENQNEMIQRFTNQLIDILEKKELNFLRLGALATAQSYSCERIANQAVGVYATAIRNRMQREELRLRGRNKRPGMVYFQW